MKPLGMTEGFRVIRPTRAMDLIWDAVEAAIAEGMTVEEFRREARQGWAEAMDRAKERAMEQWRKP